MFDLVPNHIHFARIFEDGKPAAEYFFSVDNRRQVIKQYGQETQEVAVHATAGYLFTQYLLLGIEHLGNGLDHLAFLLAVILLVGRVREVLIAITGFTIGHSITLALTVLDILRPTAEAIEALIGFTIAIVAFESVGQRTGATKGLAKLAGCVLIIAAFLAWRGGSGVLSVVSLAGLALFTVSYLLLSEMWRGSSLVLILPLTTVFGLLHGFGFAGNLLTIGVPAESLAPVLLGFNLGVEVGHFLIVTAIGVTAFLLRPLTSPRHRTWALDSTMAA